eukprot:4857694-Amphidinium_carterae.1
MISHQRVQLQIVLQIVTGGSHMIEIGRNSHGREIRSRMANGDHPTMDIGIVDGEPPVGSRKVIVTGEHTPNSLARGIILMTMSSISDVVTARQ